MGTKIQKSIWMSVLSLTVLVASLTRDTVASDGGLPPVDYAVVQKSDIFEIYTHAFYVPPYVASAADVAVIANELTLSFDHDIDLMTLLLVTLALIGMRLWRRGNKHLPAIG